MSERCALTCRNAEIHQRCSAKYLGLSGPQQGTADLETIDSELRLIAAVRWSIREHGGEPSSRQVDELLGERLALRLGWR
jgi:hypothetical protein